jgi:soluble lytic murein transglycosylase
VSPARTAASRGRPRHRADARPKSRRRRWLAIAAAATLGAGAAIGISRIDFEKAIRELTLPLRHDDIIRQQAADKNVDPSLIAGVIYAESRFRNNQESEAGALGLMQITPETADLIAHLSGGTQFVTGDLSNADINIRYGSYYLSYLLRRYEGNEVAALAAYHAGMGNVDRWGGAGLDLDAIGFPETRAYVVEVLDKRQEYRDKYADDLGIR